MLNFRRERAFKGQASTVQVDGKNLRILSQFSKQKHSARLQVGVLGTQHLQLRVEREGVFGQVLRRLGVGHELTVGAADLDRDLLFESDDPRAGEWFRSSSIARDAVRELFALGAEKLLAYDNTIRAEFAGKDIDDDVHFKTQVAAPLRQLSLDVGERFASKCATSNRLAQRALLVLALSSGLLIAALLMFFRHATAYFPAHADAGSLYSMAFFVGTGLGFALWWIAAQWLKDSSRARVVLLELGTVGIGSCVAFTMLSAASLNVSLARAPEFKEVVTTASTYTTTSRRRRGGSSTTYYLRLPALHDGAIPARSYRVSSSDYHTVRAGTPMNVVSQRGAFGRYFVVRMPTATTQP
jgi:hypothetical protein